MRTGRLVPAVLLLLVGLGGALLSPSAATAERAPTSAPPQRAPAGQDLDWEACEPATADFECATVRVPLDYDEPRRRQIGIRVIRRPAADPSQRLGSIFWNAGGPGGVPTASLPLVYSLFPQGLRDRFDIVSLDPRGIGESAQLRCFVSPEREDALLAQLPPGGFAVTEAEERQAIDVFSRFNDACARNGGPIRRHMSTANVARDMDRVRAALGEPRLHYYGPSYGTYLGVTYANLFPERTGRIVLDGNVPPQEWNDARLGRQLNTFVRVGSPFGAEIGLQMMLRACGEVDGTRCAFSAGTPDATVDKYRTLLRRVSREPVDAGGQELGYNLVVATVGSSLAIMNANELAPGWRELAELLQSLWDASAQPDRAVPADELSSGARAVLRSEGSPLSGAALPALARAGSRGGQGEEFPPQLFEGTYGVLCGESPNPRDPTSWGEQSQVGNAGTPDGFGYLWSWLAAPCAEWRAPLDADRYTGPWNRFTRPYLLIGTLGDSNTPYSGTTQLAAEVPRARVLTETGGGHTALLNKSDCIDDHVDAYFIDGTLPPRGEVCAQNAPPF